MPIWYNVEGDYLKSIGIDPRPGLVEQLRPLTGDEVAVYFQTEYGINLSKQEIHDGRDRLAEEFYASQAPLKDGVVEVLDALSARGVKMCVATATDRRLIETAFRRCGISGYFEKIFSCVEEQTSKSSPDIYIRAAGFLGTDVEDTLVIEDSLHGIVSAKKAGFPTIAVYDFSHDDQQDEIKSLCDYYWESIGGMMEILR